MNITELTDQLASERNLSKTEARQTIDAVLQAIVDAAKAGSEVSLPGFGKFKVQDKPEREGRNPATGATMTIAASRKLSFTPAKAVKDALNA
ncbi:HU family DNA-binding protein [Govanella unica]|uniref:HU family DNA-binding protein n=1 Tax=Govanella unica TaxID=2975056 RepID=A0A9X3Z7H8_9PROT|nr:HU family DNA-binding protein [Govania unica]MDA5194176.1 HU family DNA-binding protein [Govania unica]